MHPEDEHLENGVLSTPSSLLSGVREAEHELEHVDPPPRHEPLRHFRHRGDDAGSENENFKVVIRVRPPLPREQEAENYVDVVKVPADPHPRAITITEHLDAEDGRGSVYSSQTYTFDRVYHQDSKQQDVYEHTARPAVEAVLKGYNATMIAYGQTGTGKTYTMEGVGQDQGIIPRATEDIFRFIRQADESCRFRVRASYLQIYNEVISDLLRSDRKNLPIREAKRGVYVDRLSEWVVRSPQEIYGLMDQGSRVRVTGNTRMSELSSRSHALFSIVCEMTTDVIGDDGEVMTHWKIGKLNIVDLAGSEKVRQSGATGTRLEESKYINKSLSHLGNVIAALTSVNGRLHVPYRDSKLTRILEDSLGGNCKTTMIATISPALESYSESLSTLKYANRAKNIKNDAVVNEDLDQRALIKKYERELKELRAVVHQSAANRQVLEERHRQSEQDRCAALAALRARSAEAVEGKRVKERLAGKISELEKGNGFASAQDADGIAFQNAIHKVSEEYMSRLDELDKERQVIEEDKAQVDRYKQLLLKQRDIMIQLTTRLNERDGSILSQQEELDAYDEQQRLMEEALEAKTEQMLRVQAGRGCVHCCGPGFTPPPPGPGISEPTFVLSELKRALWSGCEMWLRENCRPDEGGAREEHYLPAEEKIRELYGFVIALRQELEMQPPNIRQRLLDAQEEKTTMEYILSERVSAIVQAETTERIAAYKREVEQWKSNTQLAEEHLRNAEYTIELSKLSREGQQQSDLHSRVKEYIAREVAAVRAQCEERLAEGRREVDAAEAQRKQSQREAGRLHFELHTLKRRFNLNEGSGVPEADRMWRRVQTQEDEARQGCKDSGGGRHPFNDVSNVQGLKEPTPQTKERVKSLEARIEVLKWQHSQLRAEYTEKLEEKDAELSRLRDESMQLQQQPDAASSAEVSQLKRSLATEAKERVALKTIMQTRIKPKLDNVSLLLRGCCLPSAPPEHRQKLDSEVSQLQNLVNVTMQAI